MKRFLPQFAFFGRCSALIGSCILLFGCAQSTAKKHAHIGSAKVDAPHLTPAEAVHIANRAAEKSGDNLAQYKEPLVNYDSELGTWFVTYFGKEAFPGNWFSYDIDDRTKEVTLEPGD